MRSRFTVHAAASRGSDLLEEWVAAGLIASDQADRIRAHEEARHGRRPRSAVVREPVGPAGTTLVVEALGYLGGVIMLVGAGIVVGVYWVDIPVGLRLVLGAVTALTFLLAGLAVPDRLGVAAGRLRSVLWLLAVAATAALLMVWSNDVLERYDEDALIVVFPPTAVVAAALWWTRRTWLQQLALLVSLVLSAAAVGVRVAEPDWVLGASMWMLAAAWTAVAWTGRLRPRATGVAFGGLAAILAALTTTSEVGIILGLATAAAVLVLALYERSLPWLAVAAFGLFQAAPRAAFEWFPGRLSAAVTLVVAGGLLVGAAVWVARHRGEPEVPIG